MDASSLSYVIFGHHNFLCRMFHDECSDFIAEGKDFSPSVRSALGIPSCKPSGKNRKILIILHSKDAMHIFSPYDHNNCEMKTM